MLLAGCVSIIPTHTVAQTTAQTTSQATSNTQPETTSQALVSEAPETNQGLTVTKQVVFRGINELLDLGTQRLRDVSRFDVSVRQSTGEVMLWVAGSPSYHFFDPRSQQTRSVAIPSEFTDLRYRHMITRDQPDDVLIWDNAGGEIASFNIPSGAMEIYTDEPARKSMIGSGMVPIGDAMVFLGGYGFWETHNTIAKFNRSDATWSSVEQTKPLPSSMSGVFFKGRDQELYTLFPNVDSNTNLLSFDGFKVLTSKAPYSEWRAIHEFSSSPMSTRKRNPQMPTLHLSNPDYMLHGLVIESEFTRNGHFEGGVLYYNARDNEVRTFYNPDLGAKHRLLSMFYLDVAKSWVIMSQLHNNDDELYFNFVEIYEDGANATLHANGLESQKRKRALQATAAGLGSTALVGFLMFFRRQRTRSWVEATLQHPESNSTETHDQVALRPIMDQDSFVGVVVDGQEEDLTRDGQYQKFWALLLDAIRRGQESLPLQDIDEAVFHAGVKQPQRTRSRARFVERINTLAGTEILQIARSPVDRRYRVLQIQHEAIRLISDSST